ncbi:unnamed protein product [Paramecium sonneborni]|uniref:dTMP kinase n=1 Tax=Paramecium sonneborni TaxID=65129 RepID=A0A8S1KKD7_9CILI|nr:unnamed protein product [Paramecium sonneborni]
MNLSKITFRKFECKKISFPDRTTQLRLIIQIIQKEHDTFIQKELQNDTNIVSDRYAYSGVAFSATKNLTIEWCKVPDSGLIIQSDMTFYLTGPIEKLSQRGDFGKEIYENSSFQNKMKAFLINQHFKRTFTKLMLLRVLMKFKQKFQTIYKN